MENNTLTRYRDKLKNRIKWAAAYNFFVVLIIFLNRTLGNQFAISDMAHGFTIGFLVGIQLLVVIGMFKIQGALRDEAKLKALYIKDHDERTIAIEEKIGGLGINLIIAVLGIATLIAIYLNQTVFLTLLGALAFTVLIKGGLKLYFRRAL